MKKTELVEIIRTLVREEVNNSLPQLLMEVLAEKITANSPGLVETKSAPLVRQQPAPARRSSPVVQFEAPIKLPPVAAPKVYSTNPTLNAVLNETRGGIPDEVETTSIVDATINSLPREVIQENAELAGVINAINRRDYSKVLKAIEQKVKR